MHYLGEVNNQGHRGQWIPFAQSTKTDAHKLGVALGIESTELLKMTNGKVVQSKRLPGWRGSCTPTLSYLTKLAPRSNPDPLDRKTKSGRVDAPTPPHSELQLVGGLLDQYREMCGRGSKLFR
jgi:hypothetical protein